MQNDQSLVVQINWGRRALYGAIGVLLVLAFVVSYDSQTDQGSVVGLVFYALLTIAAVGVAAWNSRTVFVRDRSTVQTQKRLFGIVLKSEEIDAQRINGVTLQAIRLLRTQEIPQQGLLNSRFRGFASRRSQYFKLFLEIGERRVMLEDSSYRDELEAVATSIAEYLNVPLQNEEV